MDAPDASSDHFRIPLTRGLFAVVDAEDFVGLSARKWTASGTAGKGIYAVSYVQIRGKPGAIIMHRQIAGALAHEFVDHINGDKLDNRRQNLRICTAAENVRNRRSVGAASGFKGVHKTRGQRWEARIKVNGRYLYLGVFDTPQDAARVYDVEAIKHFGEFACTNEELGLYATRVELMADPV